MLGVFSCPTFPVNLYLGLRHLGAYNWLRILSIYVYGPCIAMSFVWQLQHVWAHFVGPAALLYITLLTFIFYDDAVLFQFLATPRRIRV